VQRKGSVAGGYATNPMPGVHRKSSVISKNLKNDEKIKFQEILENEMKTKIGMIFNNSSGFFWYPPHGLLTERYIM
jgi:hypothetical protein